jgi:uncharacterized membrane protein YjgN (DUF898 family)
LSDPFTPTQPLEPKPQPANAPGLPALDPIPRMPAATPTQPFTFTGSGSEYFRIWIVNLLLTIVTVGIYSAWAKVRKLKYFYSNTYVAGESFEYHGKPFSILKGRLIALALFGAYNLAFKVSPFLGFAALILLAVVMPWLLWKSFQFKLYNSSYRGLRFGFFGGAKGAYVVFLVLPLAFVLGAALIVGIGSAIAGSTKSVAFGMLMLLVFLGVMLLMYPMIHHRLKLYQHNNSRYGHAQFSINASFGQFLQAYFLTGLFLVGGMVLLGLIAGAGLFSVKDPRALFSASFIIMIALFYALFFAVAPVLGAMVQNIVWNGTKLEDHQFQSQLSVSKAAWVAVTNILGVIVTLGLFLPFAQVRAAKLKLEAMALVPASDLESFAAAQQQAANATGEGMADLMDFDIGM